MNDRPELSVVTLCYKAEEAIIPFSKKLKEVVSSLTDSYEIVLVGNYKEGSIDRTKEIVETIAKEDPVFKTVCKPKEGMMGWDMRTGLDMTKGEIICVIDGDGQFPVESIAECYNRMKTGKFGLVKTYREQRHDGFQRKFISNAYNLIFSILYPSLKAKDVNSKPKMFTREVFEKMDLTSDDWFIDAEMMIKINRMKVKFDEFPTEFSELEGRLSFVNFSTIFEFIRNFFKYKIGDK